MLYIGQKSPGIRLPMTLDYKSYYRRGVIVAIVLTAIAFIVLYFLPDKRLVLIPKEENNISLYGYVTSDKGISASWVNEEKNHWICDYQPSHGYGCGWATFLMHDKFGSIDFTGYEAIELRMAYKGPATRIRLFIRNFNPAYSIPSDLVTYKSMDMSFRAGETSKPVRVDLAEFSVSSWWLFSRKVHQQWPFPEFQAISNLGVDFIEPGLHEVEIKQVALVGKWITTETLLLIVLSFWMALFLMEGFSRFYFTYRKVQVDHQTIYELRKKHKALIKENESLENKTETDALTGINNRAGLYSKIQAIELEEGSIVGLGVLLLDLDKFKALNDRFGHDVGDLVLKSFASNISMNLRGTDLFARFGGEEFVLLCREQPVKKVLAFAEKIRLLTTLCAVEGVEDLSVSVSIGVSVVEPGEEFGASLKRADIALYRAKQKGRNRVEYESQ